MSFGISNQKTDNSNLPNPVKSIPDQEKDVVFQTPNLSHDLLKEIFSHLNIKQQAQCRLGPIHQHR